MKSIIFRLLPTLALMPLAIAWAQTDSVAIDRIVALVEEDVVLQSELDQAFESIEHQIRATGETPPPRSVLEEQLVERLIVQRLQLQRAEQTGIRVSDADVDDALARVAQQNNMSLTNLREALESDGISFESFREEMRHEIMVSRLQQRVINSMDEITETEIDIFLASDRFDSGEFLLSQILIAVPESATPEQVSDAEARVSEVYQRLDEGMAFSAAAISFSQGPDALEGGDIGWRSLRVFPDVFAEAIQDLNPGEVSQPIRTQAGLVILQVRDRREQGEMIIEEYRARHFMVVPSDLVTADQARVRINDFHQRILAGEDFAELARASSDDQSTANLGGLLDWFPGGAYGTRIQEVIATLQPGELSEPFQTSSGWHLLRLEDVRQADRTEEILRSEARQMLAEQKSHDEVERFIRELRNESFVELRL